jgi:hypothetical protein
MIDTNEIEALKASYRGALVTGAALLAFEDRVEALDARVEIAAGDLEDLSRVALAHAVAAQALRGLIETMRTRRGA